MSIDDNIEWVNVKALEEMGARHLAVSCHERPPSVLWAKWHREWAHKDLLDAVEKSEAMDNPGSKSLNIAASRWVYNWWYKEASRLAKKAFLLVQKNFPHLVKIESARACRSWQTE